MGVDVNLGWVGNFIKLIIFIGIRVIRFELYLATLTQLQGTKPEIKWGIIFSNENNINDFISDSR
jgi:hypothetical protein